MWACFQAGAEYCFALADGLGGHGKGEVASRIAVEQAVAAFAEAGKASEEVIRTAFGNAQDAILAEQRADRTASDMKTTFVYLLVGEEEIRWAHIGDSRLYRFERGKLAERTLDHSVPQMLVAAGEIKEKQIRHHPGQKPSSAGDGGQLGGAPVSAGRPGFPLPPARHSFCAATDSGNGSRRRRCSPP